MTKKEFISKFNEYKLTIAEIQKMEAEALELGNRCSVLYLEMLDAFPDESTTATGTGIDKHFGGSDHG